MITTYFCRMGNHHATLEEMKADTISKLGNGKIVEIDGKKYKLSAV